MKTLEELEQDLAKLDFTGRDPLHTHLITQELSFWLDEIYDKKRVLVSEVRRLAARRGFNNDEQKKFESLANWLNTHAKELRACEPSERRVKSFTSGYVDGVSTRSVARRNKNYAEGYKQGANDLAKATKAFTKKLSKSS